ncbi:MAG: 30S ribosomal protein S12 methylthiotransferase RimO, partial [Acutalibacteraceae bacterium]
MAVRVGMVSLGCAKNRVDAEMMLFSLREAGFELVADVGYCDVAIVNTCGFIEDAKQESIDEILELAQLKKEGRLKAIIVTGCLAERYQSEVMKELYEIDAVVGLGSNADIADIINKVLAGEKVEAYGEKETLDINAHRVRTTPYYYAYLKIAEGCDNHCTYCAIPMIRGKYRSRTMESILEEAKDVCSKGVKELILVAQDTTRYGEDLYGKPMLSELLKKLAELDEVSYIRVLYCYPDYMTDELIDTIAHTDKVLKYIDLPLQHCSKNVLKRMNRHGDYETLTALIQKLRKEIPDLTLRTTLLTGFPGETEEDFEELSKFVQEMRFDRMGCFAYSAEEGTAAAKFKDQIDDEVKAHRCDMIMEQQHDIMCAENEKMIGRTINVLCEGFDRYAECFYGRSKADAPEVDGKVFFTAADKKPKIGDVVPVSVTSTLDCDLVGEYLG